jgi:ubiquinone biosynthesis protein
MVVVEGVARTLDPHMNIWDVAKPIVEDYIKTSIGPQALLRDLAKTVRVLARFGPRLPGLAEAALIRTTNPAPDPKRRPVWPALGFMALGGGFALVVLWVWRIL